MSDRKPISNKIRFEIFKRDSFTCQYCGKKAPGIVLEIDHITPVKHKGKNDILNLVTSCFECNSGKSDRLLADNTIIEIQRNQIDELQERKNQIEMMLKWKLELSNIVQDESKKVIEYYNSKWEEFDLNEFSQKDVRGLVKKYGAIKVIDMIDECYLKYGVPSNEKASFGYVLSKIKSTLKFNSLNKEEQAETLLVRQALRIAKSKFYTFDYEEATRVISSFTRRGGTGDELVDITNESSKFSEWKQVLY